MPPIWLEHYPPGVPAEANILRFAALKNLLEQRCGRFRARPAYTNLGVSLSDDKLELRSRELGAWLQREDGLKRGERVAIMLPQAVRYPVALFGALRAGMVAHVKQTSAWIGNFLREGEEVVITPQPLCQVFAFTVNLLTFVKWGGNNVLITNPRDIPSFIASSRFALANRYLQ